jgi:DNA replication protein DnaC
MAEILSHSVFKPLSAEQKREQADRLEAEAKKRAFKKKQEQIETMNIRWKLANVPEIFHHSQMEAFMKNPVEQQDMIDVFNQRKILKLIKELKPTKQNILFHGLYGLGKSYFASWYVRKAISLGLTAGFIRAYEYVALAKSKDFKNNQKADRFLGLKVLILDEIGDDNIPDWERIHLKELIIARASKGLKTIMTTNLSIDELKDYLAGRAKDRFFGYEDREAVMVNFNQANGAMSLRGRV